MSTKQPDETQARWYMVNKDGMATLCKDHADAKQEAADAQAAWPHLGPHRAVQLVEAPLMGAAGDAGWVSVDERLPAMDELVLVYAPPQPDDHPGDVRISFDCICPDWEYWRAHSENYDHYMAVGGPAACGPDCVCTGPSEKALYTHWMKLPEAPNA